MQSWSTKFIPAIKEYASTLSGKVAALVAEARKKFDGMFFLLSSSVLQNPLFLLFRL